MLNTVILYLYFWCLMYMWDLPLYGIQNGSRQITVYFTHLYIVIMLAGMTCMMFIPCILVQDEAETRLNRNNIKTQFEPYV